MTAIVRLLSDPDEARRFGEQGYERLVDAASTSARNVARDGTGLRKACSVRPFNVLHLRDTYEVGGPGKTILETYRAIDAARFRLHLGVFQASPRIRRHAVHDGSQGIRHAGARGPRRPTATIRDWSAAWSSWSGGSISTSCTRTRSSPTSSRTWRRACTDCRS